MPKQRPIYRARTANGSLRFYWQFRGGKVHHPTNWEDARNAVSFHNCRIVDIYPVPGRPGRYSTIDDQIARERAARTDTTDRI